MKILGLQFDVAWEDKPANYQKVSSMLATAGPKAGSLVVLPEMFATGFSMNVAAVAEDPDGPTGRFLSALARQHAVHLIAGISAIGDRGRGRNLALVYDADGNEAARYAKMHLFSYAGENDHYLAGREPIAVQVGDFLAAPLICYDLRFPELFRRQARKGVHLFMVVANWPAPRRDHWRALLQARAIENQAFVVGVNRCGSSPSHAYAGDSLIIDPQGAILADAGDGETVIEAEIDLPALLAWRRDFPALRDMRPDGEAG